MNCFKNDIIQKYIDGEASPKEVARMEKHMSDCEKCAAKVEHQRQLSLGIKNAVNLLVKDRKDLPMFHELRLEEAPSGPQRMRNKTLKWALYSLPAACILLFLVLLSQRKDAPKERPSQNRITIIYSLSQQVDANQPITEHEMVITVIDSHGNIIEYPSK